MNNISLQEREEIRQTVPLLSGTVVYQPGFYDEKTSLLQLQNGKFVRYFVESGTIIVTNVSELLCG